jgi:hypothetical protein
MASTFFLVIGALLVGDALHGSIVTSQYPVTSPASVVRWVVGLACIAVGARLRTPPEEYASMPSEESEGAGAGETGAETGDYDPELSPLDDEQFENLEADDGK